MKETIEKQSIKSQIMHDSMRTFDIKSSEELVEKLEELYKQGDYIFRGHSDSRYLLTPCAFRENERKKKIKKFSY